MQPLPAHPRDELEGYDERRGQTARHGRREPFSRASTTLLAHWEATTAPAR